MFLVHGKILAERTFIDSCCCALVTSCMRWVLISQRARNGWITCNVRVESWWITQYGSEEKYTADCHSMWEGSLWRIHGGLVRCFDQ